jgi:hypothetical protein
MPYTPNPKREITSVELFMEKLKAAQDRLEAMRRKELHERLSAPLRACPNSHWFYKN